MRRKLNREEFAQTNPFVQEKDRHLPLLWAVYKDYEVVSDGVSYPYLVACEQRDSDSPKLVGTYYSPLTETPYMFREFAQIVEERDPEQELYTWISKYGLLGLSREADDLSEDHLEDYPEMVLPPFRYDDAGGPGETLAAIWQEAGRANEALTLYEAALTRDEERLGHLLSEAWSPEEVDKEREHYLTRKRETKVEWGNHLADNALGIVWEIIEGPLMAFTYPYVNIAGSWNPRYLLTPERLVASWKSRNLLGAMYLQFYWLITSAAEKSLCRYCGRLIFDTPPLPQGGGRQRKPRSDKQYCNKQCRENHNYHTRIKPKRQAERRTSG